MEREVRMLKEVMSKPEVMLRRYVGEIISKSGEMVRVYVSKLGWITEMEKGSEEMEIGSKKEIRVYVFENEEKMSKKVRIGGT